MVKSISKDEIKLDVVKLISKSEIKLVQTLKTFTGKMKYNFENFEGRSCKFKSSLSDNVMYCIST